MKFNKFPIIILIGIVMTLVNGCKSDDLLSWIGEYDFDEMSPSAIEENVNLAWSYTIQIYEEKDGLFADINVDGFQRMERIHSKIFKDNGKINLVFDSYLPDNMFEQYKQGDVLLSLERTDSDIITIWGEMKPMVLENLNSGVYFQKVDDTLNSK